MARYGRDYGGWFPEGGMGRYDRRDYRHGFHGMGPAGGWSPPYDRDVYPEGAGWSGPGPGRYGGGRGRQPGGRWSAGWGPGAMERDWDTGQPWGGEGDADRIRAADIMTENPEAVTPETPLAEVAARMRDLDVGIIPVVNNEDDYQLQGVITDRDIAIRAAAEGMDTKTTRVADCMTTNVKTVGENDHVRDVFTVMKRERVRRVPVTDRSGKLVGIIAQADLAVNYAGLDLQRETEVEEVIERISEPARPQWKRERNRSPWARASQRRYAAGGSGYDGEDLGERIRHGWETLRREARQFLGRGYDRGW